MDGRPRMPLRNSARKEGGEAEGRIDRIGRGELG